MRLAKLLKAAAFVALSVALSSPVVLADRDDRDDRDRNHRDIVRADQQDSDDDDDDNDNRRHRAQAGPVDAQLNFCPASLAKFERVKRNEKAGIEYSSRIVLPLSTIAVPTTGVNVAMYVKNVGPGPITYVFEEEEGLGAWGFWGRGVPTGFKHKKGKKVHQDVALNVFTPVPLKPKGSSAQFSDGGWGGTQDEQVGLIGCTAWRHFTLPKAKGKAHMDLSFFRGTELHTVRVNFHFE